MPGYLRAILAALFVFLGRGGAHGRGPRAPRAPRHRRPRPSALLPLLLLLSCGSGCASLRAQPGPEHAQCAAADAAHQPVGSKGEVAKWIIIGTAIAAVFFIDLIILPATYHDPFPCCRAVISCH